MKKHLKYKGVTVGAFGLPVLLSNKKDISRRGEPGRKYFQYQRFIYNFKNTAPRDLIVMYDIPTEKKKEREWFRRHLQKFGYVMIQKSVWVGPSPLPRNFLDYVKKLGLLSQLRTLKLAKPYSRYDRNM
jgi:DNA-binding transcriptional regulator PaaX